MKLLRVGELKKEIPAVLDKENKIRNLSNYIENCMLKGVLELAGPALAASALVPMQVSADIAAI